MLGFCVGSNVQMQVLDFWNSSFLVLGRVKRLTTVMADKVNISIYQLWSHISSKLHYPVYMLMWFVGWGFQQSLTLRSVCFKVSIPCLFFSVYLYIHVERKCMESFWYAVGVFKPHRLGWYKFLSAWSFYVWANSFNSHEHAMQNLM